MMKTMITRFLAAPVASAMMFAVLCGYTPANTSHAASAAAPSVSVSSPAEKPVEETKPATSASTVRDRYKRLKEQQNAEKQTEDKPSQSTENNTKESAYGVSEIAKIGKIYANVEQFHKYCRVYVEDDHNPYDVVWDYGKEYQKFVDAVEDADMWDVLFDAEFYKANYPMLAMLYHDNDALLREHFQTVGIHEGRQGSDAFNVAAYMENCDAALKDAFGDRYECYYFYWALNQNSESKVSTVSDSHPLQMCVKLTTLQEIEFNRVNDYREEAGVGEVTVDPEFLALANYRAWLDYTGDYTAHEWLDSHNDEAYEYLDVIGSDMLSENTVSGSCRYTGPERILYYFKYYHSEKHYKAMVSNNYAWFGCSNAYWGPDGDGDDNYRHCQYDLYTTKLSTYMNP